jgi:hypothetical protein
VRGKTEESMSEGVCGFEQLKKSFEQVSSDSPPFNRNRMQFELSRVFWTI